MARNIESTVDALKYLMEYAEEAHERWDADDEMKVGKMLLAMSGRLPMYDAGIDQITELVKSSLSAIGCINNTIKTFGGLYFDLANPTPEQVELKTIVATLSRLVRFGGHSPGFYTVAEHCVKMTRLARRQHRTDSFQRYCLLHDASEAYTIDLPKPLKIMIPDYSLIESRVMLAIVDKFGLNVSDLPGVKALDLVMLKSERHAMWPEDDTLWTGFTTVEIDEGFFPEYWEPHQAADEFLDECSILGLDEFVDCSKIPF